MREKIKLLKDLELNEEGIIKEILVEGNIRRRLQDIGVVPLIPIKCILISPLNDPKAFLIKGSVIAIREEETSLITVVLNEMRDSCE